MSSSVGLIPHLARRGLKSTRGLSFSRSAAMDLHFSKPVKDKGKPLSEFFYFYHKRNRSK